MTHNRRTPERMDAPASLPRRLRANLPILAAMLVLIAAVLVPAPERASALQPGAHSDSLRTEEELTSGTLRMAEEVRKARLNRDEKFVDFDLLMRTKIRRRPPPEYPERLSELDLQTVKILGFMVPFDSLTDMRKFMLFPTPMGCYFCTPPSPLEVVFIRRTSDKEEPFIGDLIEVEGKLSLWREGSRDAGHKMFLYIIDDAKIRVIE